MAATVTTEDSDTMADRIESLKQWVAGQAAAGVRRTTYFPLIEQSLRETMGKPTPVRRALAFKHLLRNVQIVVSPHELIAGSILGMWPLAEGLPSCEQRRREARAAIEDYLQRKRAGTLADSARNGLRWALMERDHYNANIPYDELQALISELAQEFTPELTRREIGRELEHHFNFDYGPEVRRLMDDLPWASANHLDLNYQRVVQLGIGGLRARIHNRLAQDLTSSERTVLNASLMAMDAFGEFVVRHSVTLGAMALIEPDAARAAELHNMAEVCRRVSEHRPETFREALQLVWLTHIAAGINGGNALSFARFDQYMLPFFERDLHQAVLTREQTAELVACLWVKVNEPHMRTVQSLCLAGRRPDGMPGANELSRVCIEVCRRTRLPYPNTAVRLHSESPAWLLDDVAETVRSGFGQPMVLNDDLWIDNLARLGYRIEDARDYYNMGCVEIMIMGKVGQWRGAGGISFPALLNDYLRSRAQDPPADFGEALNGFLATIRRTVSRICREPDTGGRFSADDGAADPFASALLDDCVERARDMYRGGARYPDIRPVSGVGLATAVDALSALQTHVYAEKAVTYGELLEALDSDFAGRRQLQQRLAARTPCFGNDIPEVDAMAADVFEAFCSAVAAENTGERGPFVTVLFSYTGHVFRGENLGATANGRRAGDTISNGMGPTQGKDHGGPTAMINSVLRLDHSGVTGAYALNLKLSRQVLDSNGGSEALRALLTAYIAGGGPQMQINVISQADLEAAIESPERHGDLVVRVGGYSEYFVKLDRQLQEEIVRRTAHSLY